MHRSRRTQGFFDHQCRRAGPVNLGVRPLRGLDETPQVIIDRTENSLRTNYVLIDYESVQPDDLSALKQDHFRVIVFVGAHQNKIAFETAAALQQLDDRHTKMPEIQITPVAAAGEFFRLSRNSRTAAEN